MRTRGLRILGVRLLEWLSLAQASSDLVGFGLVSAKRVGASGGHIQDDPLRAIADVVADGSVSRVALA